MTTLAWGALTDTGRIRDVNQDGVFSAEDVFVVADGMGGHRGGEVASAIVVEEMAKITAVSSTDELIEMVQQANLEVLERAREDPSLYGMGTTMVALVAMTEADTERLCVVNVGDSRLYVRTDEEMLQLTDDHSLVEGMVRDGWISPEEAMVHPQRNVVTRALGVEDELLVDAWELQPVTGDRYLLCSDGLTNELSDAEILEILDETDDPVEAASSLVQAACAAGGRDNVTVVVVDVVDAESTESEPPADRVIATRKAVHDDVDVEDSTEAADAATADEGTSDESESLELDSLSWRSFLDWRSFETWPLKWFAAVALVVLVLLLVLLAVL
ncbi:MAG: Stp1/IreP family PP2C-type Ser/Thr phosphatase [Acidimicrobiaceae bacterium]|nr:Stp1/IreP family PP2C-type Ser/Thr phosphatase [Acidimicrobiaceae bacterium]MXW76376.1 Stp1/IreP family PP2C-type Ser/Thr phosphatase [Acidimicrobiaceae bacterium]MYA75633.1 Stp1/IreP family PP2C-type Ser/Thr phosphatase [Acidimicrobiaceae bacterium]MYC42896.1 Stp1/IreP family PP2C-type Ser/Thr phosphatase [Acidimicrobiaceae bacterium]MYD07444.1 Stp1/IreP family PP2C-type Ser/Thr phosphatase [Acidimicrobiaceae bacterium]